MMGATLCSLAIVGAAALVSGILSRWIAKTITLSPETNATTRSCKTAQRLDLRLAESRADPLTVCVAVMLLLSAWGLF